MVWITWIDRKGDAREAWDDTREAINTFAAWLIARGCTHVAITL